MDTKANPPLHRRHFLEMALVSGALAGSALPVGEAWAADGDRLTIDGYTNPLSAQPGEVLNLHISTNADKYALEIARVGMRDEVVWTKSDLRGAKHPVLADAAMNGCQWPVAYTLTIPKDWRSGYYRVLMRGTKEGRRSAPTEMFFILRPAHPGRGASILFQLSTNTYQAYNLWGGTCLYSGPNHPRVSFNRPFLIYDTPRQPSKDWYNPNTNCCHTWDLPFIAWAERAGYAIDYCANLDLEQHPQLVKPYRLVLSVGHDEYWSATMRDTLESFIARGGNAFFLSGNSVCWQVRVEDNGRALVCHKREHERDPVFKTADRRFLTTLWSDALVKRPENQLTGVGFAHGGYNGLFGEFMTGPGAGEYTVHRPKHWIFAGTGLQQGATFGGEARIAGYECDGCEFILKDGLPVPTGRDGTPKDFLILATTPARWSPRDSSRQWARELRRQLPPQGDKPENHLDRDGAGILGMYQRGGTIVTVGSCDWTNGLTKGDRVVDRIVRNVLERLSK